MKKCILIVHILVTSAALTLSDGACNFTTLHVSANNCLSANNVAAGTEFLFPVLENNMAVINFCTRTLLDIKACLQTTVSSCGNSNNMIRMLFGHQGEALLAAYEGICSENTKVEALTCAYHHASYINSAVHAFFSEMDELTHAVKYNVCSPLQSFHIHALTFFEDAVHSNHCSHESHMIMEKFLQTIEFKCMDIATSYYPCTLARINSDVIGCFAASSVTVRSAFVPAPGLAHADVMCSSKSTILECFHNHLAHCMHEEQVMVIGMGEEYSAAYECMCALDNADMVLSCPSTADMATAMNKFFSDVHTSLLDGENDKESLCTKMMVMKTRITNAINSVCLGETDRMYWNTFLSTISYSCTEKATSCYPHKGSGSDPNISITITSVITLSIVGLGMLFL